MRGNLVPWAAPVARVHHGLHTTAKIPKGNVRLDQDTMAMDWGGGDTERGLRGV